MNRQKTKSIWKVHFTQERPLAQVLNHLDCLVKRCIGNWTEVVIYMGIHTVTQRWRQVCNEAPASIFFGEYTNRITFKVRNWGDAKGPDIRPRRISLCTIDSSSFLFVFADFVFRGLDGNLSPE